MTVYRATPYELLELSTLDRTLERLVGHTLVCSIEQ